MQPGALPDTLAHQMPPLPTLMVLQVFFYSQWRHSGSTSLWTSGIPVGILLQIHGHGRVVSAVVQRAWQSTILCHMRSMECPIMYPHILATNPRVLPR